MIRSLKMISIIVLTISTSYSQGFWGSEFPEGKIKYDPETYVCLKTTEKLNLDGKITEKAWKSAPWSKAFVDIEGDLKPKPYHDTKVKMLWDENYFYFAALMEEPHVWAKLKERDAVI